ncbi:MAG: SAM-dependent chlorinase/fluorinase [Acidimicrobiia bacterium]|nr:SAM-dependent chlorinase/fluorinase [Acidimicrobiia bacterium]
MTNDSHTYDTITFLSDFGHRDEFVGVVHSVIRSIAPDAAVIDLCHDITPFDVRGAGLLLARSVPYLARGVVVAVVDPGVGTPRRAIAVEVGDGASVLIGPDNGVLAPAVAMVGGADRAVELTRTEHQLPADGPTFHGRDIFGPAAAALCSGVAFEELGSLVDTSSLVPGVLPVSRLEGDELIAEVLWIDRFGNAQLNVDPDEIDGFGPAVQLRIADAVRTAVRVATFGEVGPGEVGLIVDSYGLVTVVVDRGSAAADLGLDAGTEVVLVPGERAGGVATRVELGRRS